MVALFMWQFRIKNEEFWMLRMAILYCASCYKAGIRC